jgi:hypothetical protein
VFFLAGSQKKHNCTTSANTEGVRYDNEKRLLRGPEKPDKIVDKDRRLVYYTPRSLYECPRGGMVYAAG